MSAHYDDVLVVEDDETLGRIIDRNLTSRGVKVRRASSVGEALSAVALRRPQAIVLDIELPDRTGWDLLRSLHAKGIDLPTILMTATRVTAERLAEFRPVAYIPKPFPLDCLLRLVVGDERDRK